MTVDALDNLSASTSASTSPSSSGASSPAYRTSSTGSLSPSSSSDRLSKRKQLHPVRSIKKDDLMLLSNSSSSSSSPSSSASSSGDEANGREVAGRLSPEARVFVLNFTSLDLPLKGSAEESAETSDSEDADLSEPEKEFCQSLGLSPSVYLKLRESVVKDGPKAVQRPSFKKKARLDATKTKKLADFFTQKRWQQVSAQKA